MARHKCVSPSLVSSADVPRVARAFGKLRGTCTHDYCMHRSCRSRVAVTDTTDPLPQRLCERVSLFKRNNKDGAPRTESSGREEARPPAEAGTSRTRERAVTSAALTPSTTRKEKSSHQESGLRRGLGNSFPRKLNSKQHNHNRREELVPKQAGARKCLVYRKMPQRTPLCHDDTNTPGKKKFCTFSISKCHRFGGPNDTLVTASFGASLSQHWLGAT
ncbi:hypothetical protein QTO34_005839 [Cnephaeus nilssonii]|uniref:Uncharacterized protein n=1 Tax=Cnephaeus nilssonii TaxID=3371016 RepID=A0AA40HMG8_CNENI|nr:hypothetical protein QTO34_005839 [Eptesicus nilssonii]